jgi:integrase
MMVTQKQKREHGSGRLYLRGKIWWIQYYVRGRRIFASTGETEEKKASRILKHKLAEVETGTHPEPGRVRYESLREAYYSDYVANGRRSLRQKDGKPHMDKIARLDRFFSGELAQDITVDEIRRFQAEERERGLSNGAINRSVSALRRMFNLARKEERLRDVPYFPMLKESAPREGFIERVQYDTLRSALPDYLKLPLALGFYTGMRRGEVVRLKWERVDLLRNRIELRAGETKNGEARSVPIVPELRSLLEHTRRQGEFVCSRTTRRGHVIPLGDFRKSWERACGKAGLGGLLFHDLRRSAVRNLVNSGVPEKVAMEITGHKTRSVFDRYHIVSPRDLDNAAEKLGDYLQNGDKTATISTSGKVSQALVN